MANVAADAWLLPTKTDGVVDGDLVASGDNKSATFTGHLVGTATIRATSRNLVDCGLLTVTTSALNPILRSAAIGTQTALSTFTITITAQDAANNTVSSLREQSTSVCPAVPRSARRQRPASVAGPGQGV